MLYERTQLELALNKIIKKKTYNTDLQNEMTFYLEDKYEMPLLDSLAYFHGEQDLATANQHVLFCLADGMDHCLNMHLVDQYFTDAEKEVGYGYKFDTGKLKLPLRFKMIQVSEDSWIGSIDTNTLIQLQDSDFINYNASTQRVLSITFVSKERKIVRPYINQKTVKTIQEELHNRSFISNTVTLNIPLGSGKFYYDNKKNELVITELSSLDIIDGYHRLLAIIREKNSNPDFNYPMELRITNYDVSKAKQFIYQEEQKTQMKKGDINTYNTFSPANRVINKLNEDAMCVIQGKIGTTKDSIISHSLLLPIIEGLWFKDIPMSEVGSKWLTVEKELADGFNDYYGTYPDRLNQKASYRELLSIVSVIHFKSTGYIVISNLAATIDRVIKYISENIDANSPIFVLRKYPKKAALKLIKEVVESES